MVLDTSLFFYSATCFMIYFKMCSQMELLWTFQKWQIHDWIIHVWHISRKSILKHSNFLIIHTFFCLYSIVLISLFIDLLWHNFDYISNFRGVILDQTRSASRFQTLHSVIYFAQKFVLFKAVLVYYEHRLLRSELPFYSFL